VTKQLQKSIATSLTAILFVIIGISGVLMYFHLLDKYVKELHEIIGLVFVAVVFFHIYYNFKSMKGYFKTKVFWISVVLFSMISLGFILNVKEGENPKRLIIMSVLNAPISESVEILNKDTAKIKSKLKEKGIRLESDDSIMTLSKRHNVSPFEIVDIINEK